MDINAPEIFLGSNSADGFISKFSDYNKGKNDWYTYIIKGGPGTGKSSFMKKVANAAIVNGEKVIISPCSSDPNSLDAVILQDKKIMVLDGTAPHETDPIYPGVCQEILNFGEYFKKDILQNKKDKIIAAYDKNKTFHKRASLCIAAAGKVMRDNMKISLIAADIEKTVDIAEKNANKFITSSNGTANETVCFLNGITPDGKLFFEKTIDYFCNKKIIINDEKGSVSNIFMSIIRDIALTNGQSIITVKNNILALEKTDHIILPSLRIAFCTENRHSLFSSNERRIRAERFEDPQVISKNVKRIKFNLKLEKEFIKQAITALYNAKAVHDELESYYISAMDFSKIDQLNNKFIKKIFA